MNKRRTFQEYRNIDLGLWIGILIVFEFLIIHAANWWFPDQLYTVSLAAVITSIVYMRWGFWGGIHAFAAGFVFCFFSEGTVAQYIIYCVGNLFSLPAVFLLKAVGSEKVRTGTLAIVFPMLVLILMWVGRAVVAIPFVEAPSSVIGFFTMDSLSLLFTCVIIWIARRLDGVYEDQKHYLLRINAREE